MVARGDLGRRGDRLRVTDEQLGDRHREVTDERRVNQVAEVDDAADAMAVHQGVQCG